MKARARSPLAEPADSSIGDRVQRRTWTWLGLAPFCMFAIALLAYPLLTLVVGAFQDETGNATLRNIQLLLSRETVAAYWISILLSLTTAVLGGAFGALLAIAATSRGMPHWGRNQLATLSAVATNFAGVPLAFAFIATFGATGAITMIMRNSFDIDLATGFSLYSFWGLVLVYLYFQTPLMVLIVGPSLDGLRREWQEAAASLGASTGAYWRQVAFPVISPSLLGGMVLLFGNAFGAHSTAYALTGGQLPLVPIIIGQVKTGDVLSSPHHGDALALGMIVILAASMSIYITLMRKASRWRR